MQEVKRPISSRLHVGYCSTSTSMSDWAQTANLEILAKARWASPLTGLPCHHQEGGLLYVETAHVIGNQYTVYTVVVAAIVTSSCRSRTGIKSRLREFWIKDQKRGKAGVKNERKKKSPA